MHSDIGLGCLQATHLFLNVTLVPLDYVARHCHAHRLVPGRWVFFDYESFEKQ